MFGAVHIQEPEVVAVAFNHWLLQWGMYVSEVAFQLILWWREGQKRSKLPS
jgi:hypothetical protein